MLRLLPALLFCLTACGEDNNAVKVHYPEPVIKMLTTQVINDVYETSEKTIRDGVSLYEIGCYNNLKRTHFFIVKADLTKVTFTSSTPNDKPELPTAVGGDAQIPVHAGAAEANGKKVWVAFNGDFWTGNPGKPMGLFFKDGIALNTKIYEGHTEVVYMMKDGTVGIGQHAEIEKQYDQILHAVGGRGHLIQNGNVRDVSDIITDGRNPRTTIGLSKDKNTLYVFVIDGRRSWYSEGMELNDVSALMASVGCHDAINLDGGGSSTLVVRGEETELVDFPVVNKPSDASGARKIANGILIINKK